MTRVTTKTIIIPRSFILNDADGEQPPGIYTVETAEDLLDGHATAASRRVSTTLSRYDPKAKGRVIRFFEVDPEEIDAVQIRSGLPPP